MTSLIVETAEGIQLRHSLAGAGSRLAAGLLDGVLVAAAFLSLLLGAVLLSGLGVGVLEEVGSFVLGLLAGGFVLGLALYQALFLLFWDGQTPGKRMMGLRLAAADGHPPTGLQVVIRSLVWPVDAFLLVPAPLGLILMAATGRCQRLGDLAAGTVMLADESRARPREPWPDEHGDGLGPERLRLSPGMAGRLGDEDLALLRDIAAREGLPRVERETIARAAARHYGERLGFEPGEDPRRTIKELFLFARDARRDGAGRGDGRAADQPPGASSPPRN